MPQSFTRKRKGSKEGGTKKRQKKREERKEGGKGVEEGERKERKRKRRSSSPICKYCVDTPVGIASKPVTEIPQFGKKDTEKVKLNSNS